PLARRLGAAREARRRQRRARGPPLPLGRLRRAHAARLRGRARGLAPPGAAAVNPLRRLAVRGVDVLNRRGKAVGVRLVKLTRKAPYPIHPKHLVEEPWHDWYLPYLGGTEAVLDVGASHGRHLIRAARRRRAPPGSSPTRIPTTRSSTRARSSCSSCARAASSRSDRSCPSCSTRRGRGRSTPWAGSRSRSTTASAAGSARPRCADRTRAPGSA